MTIAITGATGFLGLRVLPLLMERGCPIVVLTHACSAPAQDRIERHFRRTGGPTGRARDLTVVPIDLTRPLLGLSQAGFAALGAQLTEIWHCAGSIDLIGSPELVRRVNVSGTYAMLELAAAGSATIIHVSTAFVAGRRITGVIDEDDLDGSYGFESAYQQSKFDAEKAIHDWSRRNDRPAVIFRPSLLVTDRRPPPGESSHPLFVALRLSDRIQAMMAREMAPGERLPVRAAADPDAHLNLIPVELAAQLMVGLAERAQPNGVYTAHVTYPHEVTVATLLSIFEHRYTVDLALSPEWPEDLTLLEASVRTQMRAFTPFAFHHRHYDRAALRAAGLEPSDAPPLDLPYLLAGT